MELAVKPLASHFVKWDIKMCTHLMVDMRAGKLIIVKMSERTIHLIYKFLWVVTILLVFFHDRESFIHKIASIALLLVMTTVLCFRVLESKKSWKEELEEDEESSSSTS